MKLLSERFSGHTVARKYVSPVAIFILFSALSFMPARVHLAYQAACCNRKTTVV